MMDYVPLIVILGGLGAMAFFLTRGQKRGHAERAGAAREYGWNYQAAGSIVVAGRPEGERNVLYRVQGKARDGTAWEMIARSLMRLNESFGQTLELGASTEWNGQKSFDSRVIVVPVDGMPIPDMLIGHMLAKLGAPADIPRLGRDELPAAMAGRFEVFMQKGAKHRLLESAAVPLDAWNARNRGAGKGITIVAGPDGIRIHTPWTVEKKEDMAAFISTGLAFIEG